MVVTFENFPWLLKIKILEKMEGPDFLEFMLCSSPANIVSYEIKHKIPYTPWKNLGVCVSSQNVDAIRFLEPLAIRATLEILYIEDEFTDDFCETLLKSIRISQLRIKLMYFQYNIERICCSLMNFNILLKVAEIQEFNCFPRGSPIPADYFRVPALSSVRTISRLKDQDLLSLKGSTLHINDCVPTSKGMNLFLKEWMAGKRDINWVLFIKESEEDVSWNAVLEGITHQQHPEFCVLERNSEKLKVMIESDRYLFVME